MPLSEHGLKWANGVISTERARTQDAVQYHAGRAAQLSSVNDGNQYNKRLRNVVAQHYEKRAMNEHERLHVLDTHGASILKVAKTALDALDTQNSAAEMRNVVKNCRMRLGILMDEANAAARGLAEAD
jgi:hypothetical protein